MAFRPEVFLATVEFLEARSIPYFVTGSVASSHYGEPRLTQDVDIAIELAASQARELCAAMTARTFYASEEAAVDAVHRLAQFNIIDGATNFKVDLMVIDEEGYDGLRMKRRRRGTIAGVLAWLASPEDVILKKLMAFREGGSDKHLRDIASMFRVSNDLIDREYAGHWAMRLGVSEYWKTIAKRADDAMGSKS